MSKEIGSKWCKVCDRQSLVARQSFGVLELLCHGVLTILTVGLWIIPAGLHFVACVCASARCQTCGSKA